MVETMEKKTIAFDMDAYKKTKHGSSKSKLKNKNKTEEIEINARNVRKLLLQKLNQYKKQNTTRKIRKNDVPTMTTSIYDRYVDQIKSKRKAADVNLDSIPGTTPRFSSYNRTLKSDPPYGNLKNSSKPTFREYKKISTPELPSFSINNENNIINTPTEPVVNKPIIKTDNNFKKITKRRMILGKNDKKGKRIGVMINNNKTRKNIEDFKIENKNTNIKTVKNYLRKRNFIHSGSACPSLLLREIYENIRLCGDINNINSKKLIDNYMDNENI